LPARVGNPSKIGDVIRIDVAAFILALPQYNFRSIGEGVRQDHYKIDLALR